MIETKIKKDGKCRERWWEMPETAWLGCWIGERLNGRDSKSESKRSLGNALIYWRTRGEIGLERVVFGEMSLDKCVSVKT